MAEPKKLVVLEIEERADPVMRGELTIVESISGIAFVIDFRYGAYEEIDISKDEIPRIIEFLETLR